MNERSYEQMFKNAEDPSKEIWEFATYESDNSEDNDTEEEEDNEDFPV